MTKLFLRPITNGANIARNRSEFVAIACNLQLLKTREKLPRGAIGFASHWLKNGRETVEPNRVITFESHLKAGLDD